MEPVNDSRLQNQFISAQQKISGHGDTSPYTTKIAARNGATGISEDVVTLSTDRPSTPDSSINKKPSVSVSPVERKALRDSFSVYV